MKPRADRVREATASLIEILQRLADGFSQRTLAQLDADFYHLIDKHAIKYSELMESAANLTRRRHGSLVKTMNEWIAKKDKFLRSAAFYVGGKCPVCGISNSGLAHNVDGCVRIVAVTDASPCVESEIRVCVCKTLIGVAKEDGDAV
jgi:hypothetical protein